MNLFEKIIHREIPADIVYEDDEILAFRDIQPQAPTHILVIPKRSISSLDAATTSDQALLGKLLLKCAEIAREQGIAENGYRIVTNIHRDGGQSVYHLHLHVLGGRPLNWPPG